ncbi:ArnT family glycosyltransferase [Arthrobacter sp. SD76]|uniref:ArnT family glycosyltransferase n=1 Tax=Arthrobacter sp. SD76 TaxID=3415007 RepID=UPI003C77C94E
MSISRWEKWCLAGILSTAAMFYTWALDANGWANAYYSAAVQSGLQDPAAFFFGSADAGNSITVDKPPLSLWLMGLSVRLFGLSTWSVLLPQAAATLVGAFLTYLLSRRYLPAPIALFSTALFAFTPITVLLARYNNPDPLMVLLMLAALLAGIKATESGKARFLYLAAVFLSLGFLTKQLQAFLILPSLIASFCIFSLVTWRRRLMTLGAAGMLLTLGSLAWPLIIDAIKPNSRPYVGGSSTNSMLELTLGYNGLDRVLKRENDPWTALLPEGMRSVETDAGVFRLFNANYGQEIGWLLLPALLSGFAVLGAVARKRYTRAKSVFALAVASWLVITYLVLSFMGSSFHSYYTAALAAPVALCLGLGLELALAPGKSKLFRIAIFSSLLLSAIFSRAMWQISDAYPEWLGQTLLYAELLAGALILIPAPRDWVRPAATWLAVGSLTVGPIFCSTLTINTPQFGSNPLSGGIATNPNTLSRFLTGAKSLDPAWATGLAIGKTPSPAMEQLLKESSPSCTWAAATYPGQTAARFQLGAGRPVMPLGGFAATDPSPTLERFQEWVSKGKICFLVVQPEQLKVPGNSSQLLAIQQWVHTNFEEEIVDSSIVYDLQKKPCLLNSALNVLRPYGDGHGKDVGELRCR